MSSKNCIPRVDWFGLTAGFLRFAVGVVITVTVVGAVIGIPMLLTAVGVFQEPTTLRGTPCAPQGI